MHGLEPFYGVRAKFLHGTQNLIKRFPAVKIPGFAVKLIGITDQLLLHALRAHVTARQRQVLANDIVDGKTRARVTLAYQCVTRQPQAIEQFTAYDTMTDVRFVSLAQYAGSMGTKYPYVMKHCSFVNKFPVYVKVMTVSAFQREFSHKFAMRMKKFPKSATLAVPAGVDRIDIKHEFEFLCNLTIFYHFRLIYRHKIRS